MKLFLVVLAFVSAANADVSHLPTYQYLPPGQGNSVPVPVPLNDYVPPAHQVQQEDLLQDLQYQAPVEAAPAHELNDDGYSYKTNRRVVYRRQRRDVSHLPSNEYLPPGQEVVTEGVPSKEYLAPVSPVLNEAPEEAAPAHEFSGDGYHYKTNRRIVYRRHRRDVSHLPSNEYLPPGQEGVTEGVPSKEYLAPVSPVLNEAPEEAAPAHELSGDGYHYKTNRRVVYRRQRRDVSHLPSNEYLPPGQEGVPSKEYLAPVSPVLNEAPEEVAPAHELAGDGYHYKTNRRVVYRRHRRDVSHLPSNEYLPPVQVGGSAGVPSNEYLAPQVAQVQAAIPETAPAHSQVPVPAVSQSHTEVPVPEVAEGQSPVLVPQVTEEVAPAHELAADGYHYKTHRRVVYRRHRRDVSHLPSEEYLPPGQGEVSVGVPSNEYLAPVQDVAQVHSQASGPVEGEEVQPNQAPAHELTADGYQYKTQRRVVYRRH